MDFFSDTNAPAPQPQGDAAQQAALVQHVVIDILDEAFFVEDGAPLPRPVVYWQYPMTGGMVYYYSPESLDPLPPV